MWQGFRTRGQALLQLLGLLGVLDDQSVKVALAADLELDLGGLGVLLDPGGYIVERFQVRISVVVTLSSLSSIEPTGSILPPADLDELFHQSQQLCPDNFIVPEFEPYLLDVGDFLRHLGGLVVEKSGKGGSRRSNVRLGEWRISRIIFVGDWWCQQLRAALQCGPCVSWKLLPLHTAAGGVNVLAFGFHVADASVVARLPWMGTLRTGSGCPISPLS